MRANTMTDGQPDTPTMTNAPLDKVLSIARDGQEIGEWTETQVRTFYQDGQLLGTDSYWHEGMAEWKPLRNLMKPSLPLPAQVVEEPTPAPSEPPPFLPARHHVAREPVTAIEEAMAKMGPFPDGWTPATFRRRAMARMIDYFVLTIGNGTVLFLTLLPIASLLRPSMPAFMCIVILITYPITNLIFFTWDFSSIALTGSSIGKWLFGLRVVNNDGTAKISGRTSAKRAHALLRSLWYLILYPYVTFYFAASAEKRFLNTGTTTWDGKAGTVVIGKNIGKVRQTVAVTLTVLRACLQNRPDPL